MSTRDTTRDTRSLSILRDHLLRYQTAHNVEAFHSLAHTADKDAEGDQRCERQESVASVGGLLRRLYRITRSLQFRNTK